VVDIAVLEREGAHTLLRESLLLVLATVLGKATHDADHLVEAPTLELAEVRGEDGKSFVSREVRPSSLLASQVIANTARAA
jgi:hypothetical protein